MKLWLIWGIGDFCDGWDMAQGFVIRAETEEAARRIAVENSGDEQTRDRLYQKRFDDGWMREANAKCIELSADGEAGMILRDFRAG